MNTPCLDTRAAAVAEDAAKARFNSDTRRGEAPWASHLAQAALQSYRGWRVPGRRLRDTILDAFREGIGR